LSINAWVENMTETDYVKEKLAVLKIEMTGIIGAMFALVAYNIQSSGSNLNTVIIVMIFLFIISVFIRKAYDTLLNELKDLP
jgi:hypothetical protein